MPYTVHKLTSDQLCSSIREQLSFWADPMLLGCFSHRDNAQPYYLCVIKNTNIVAVMPVFEKKKYGLIYIYPPADFLYTPIDFFLPDYKHPYAYQNETINIYKSIAQYIGKTYHKIQLTFSDTMSDLRAFKWTGFGVTPFFTYKKNIENYNTNSLSPQFHKHLKRANNHNLYAKECWDINIIEPLIKNTIAKTQMTARQSAKSYFNFLNEMYNANICTNYVVFKDDEPVACQVIFIDKTTPQIYLILAGTSPDGYKYGANIFCLDYIFSENTQYKVCDLNGANIETIAFFKSQFNCDLIHYFKIHKKLFDII